MINGLTFLRQNASRSLNGSFREECLRQRRLLALDPVGDAIADRRGDRRGVRLLINLGQMDALSCGEVRPVPSFVTNKASSATLFFKVEIIDIYWLDGDGA